MKGSRRNRHRPAEVVATTVRADEDFPVGFGYIRRSVKLEFGSLTGQQPHGVHEVRPWIAESIPDAFADWNRSVVALEAERTFWEKATILHAEHHRPQLGYALEAEAVLDRAVPCEIDSQVWSMKTPSSLCLR